MIKIIKTMKFVCFSLLLLLTLSSFSQSLNKTFLLKGTVNVDTGKIVLIQTGGQEFDPNIGNNYESAIKAGIFYLKGTMKYPTSYRIMINKSYISDYIIIESGKQTILCNIDSLREIPKIVNGSMKEQASFMDNYITPILKKRQQAFKEYLNKKSILSNKIALDSLDSIFQTNKSNFIKQQQNNFFNYVRDNPNSYVALWKLVEEMNNGYQPFYDSIYSNFSPSLKSSYTGKVLAKRLQSSKITALGQSFPTLNLININTQKETISINKDKKYTLVDFWFSRCTPCLEEFPKIKDLFKTYKSKGFNVVGISIDKNVDFKIWKRTINDNELIWSQYLDPAGEITVNMFSINTFPSNFLLDENGIIVKKNITILDLKNYLSNKLD